jgi:hypothetical protein
MNPETPSNGHGIQESNKENEVLVPEKDTE